MFDSQDEQLKRIRPNQMCGGGGNWCYSSGYRQFCGIIDTQTLWGETTCRVWLPGHDSVVRVRTHMENSR